MSPSPPQFFLVNLLVTLTGSLLDVWASAICPRYSPTEVPFLFESLEKTEMVEQVDLRVSNALLRERITQAKPSLRFGGRLKKPADTIFQHWRTKNRYKQVVNLEDRAQSQIHTALEQRRPFEEEAGTAIYRVFPLLMSKRKQ